ncbi:SURF-family protein [Rhodotorula toruloides ATCC 204091]|uniref:SURF1-like protein n=1 Tax=Rhodotorula toruloides TaxID=5286 RepID=A0A0K3CDM5_RHOTO|nr:SURF-family protein [Rhodotorula toruloides ATCC 204091]KAK4334422.1 Cytochrome oxidase assembly protein SHY1 [Rhodotorula toruloides]PRQ75208.1 SURF-family protein [Rhodotorula toruloides]
MFRTALGAGLRSAPRARAPAPPSPFPSVSARSAPRSARLPSTPFASIRHASSTSFSQSARDKLRARPFLLLVGLMPVFTFGLGVWQIKRLNWKVDLIHQLDDKLHQPPVRLPARIDTAAIPEFAWRKVFVTGTLDHEHSIELGPKTRDGQLGYHVVTPLVRGEGQDTILVNRGFVKREFKEAKDRPASLTNEPVALVGMLRDQEAPNSFTPVNQPEKDQWVFANIAEMARYTGAEPVLVDQIYDDHPGKVDLLLREGIPVGRSASIELRNMHATYAATWFSLSLATAFMFWRLMRRPSVLTTAQYRGVK